MAETSTKKNKGTISEEDIATLLQRYTATTVLTLLQEVAQCAGDKMDWNEMVKNSSTGITNVREYQRLWRHLAYRSLLADQLEDGAQPLDDESDLEYELEADPPVSSEASAEAAACVKVMIASGGPSDSSIPSCSTVEAPLTINIPNGHPSGVPTGSTQLACSKQGMNITVPISVQKQPQPALTSIAAPGTNGSAGGNMASRKKRKKWSTEEDLELIAAVQRCGEGNWANILRGDFKGDRTASQLSQRWSTLRRRKGDTNVQGTNPTVPQLTEAQLAARHAMSVALGAPAKNLTPGSGGASLLSAPTAAVQPAAAAEAPPRSSVQAQQQSRKAPVPSKSLAVGSVNLAEKSQLSAKKVSYNFGSGSVMATAVAAGARIVTPSGAEPMLKAAQGTTLPVRPTGGSSKQLPVGSGIPTQLAHTQATQNTSLPAVTPSNPHTMKGASINIKHPSSARTTSSKMSNEQNGATDCQLEGTKTLKGNKVSGLNNIQTLDKEDRTRPIKETIIKEIKEESAVPNSQAELQTRVGIVEIPKYELKAKDGGHVPVTGRDNMAKDHRNENDLMMADKLLNGGESQLANEIHQSQSTNGTQADLPSALPDSCSEKLNVLKIEEKNSGT